MLIDHCLPLAITIFSGWMLMEFLGLCHAHRKFRRMREDERLDIAIALSPTRDAPE